jgi:Mannosyl-glycoprotein endo-beta-N-acetylglucosaminidase/N-acetylmuramoyl-L-alanine amidase
MFHNLRLHFQTPESFAGWLRSQPAPSPADWSGAAPIGSVYHNTYRPDEETWAGDASMVGMQRTYEANEWDRGPHLYLAQGTRADGIYVMTPPWLPGIHAGDCNSRRWGLEVVGNFQAKPMRAEQVLLLIECASVLHRWGGLTPGDLLAHRDCMANRTCPGAAAYAQKQTILDLLRASMAGAPQERYSQDSEVMGRTSSLPLLVAAGIITARTGQNYTEKAILGIVNRYYEVAQAVGVNPLLAIAQMCHETGYLTSWWSARPRRNPAGIGVTGSSTSTPPAQSERSAYAFDDRSRRWRHGLSFASWDDFAIPAQIARLLAYATKPGTRTRAQQAFIDEHTRARPLPLPAHGSAPILKRLGHVHNMSGYGWAKPGSDYGTKIAGAANWLLNNHLSTAASLLV